jgi:hypothetical protein
MDDRGLVPRPAAIVETDDRRVVAHRDHLVALVQHEQLVDEGGAAHGMRRLPPEARRYHRAALHLAARAELHPQPVEGGPECGIVGPGHGTDGEIVPVLAGDPAVAGREVGGAEAWIHGMNGYLGALVERASLVGLRARES